MDAPKHVNRYLFGVLCLAFIGMSGCDSTGRERSDAARTSLQTMDSDLQSAIRQLDETGRSLERLMSASQDDLNQAFDTYTENVSELASLEKKFSRHADEMTSRGTDYFEEWQREGDEYQNPRIQELSEQRRTALEHSYAEIAEQSTGVDEDFKTYVSDVQEIQAFLSNDLSANGVSALTPTAQQVIREGDSLRAALEHVQRAVREAREDMSQRR